MELIKIKRKVDELGRIVLPADMRKNMGVEAGSELQIEYRNNEITLKLPDAICKLCGSTKELVMLDDSNICIECANKMQALLEKLKAGV